MALMEYCLVNIVLGDSDMPPKPINKKSFNFSFRVSIKIRLNVGIVGYKIISLDLFSLKKI